MARTALDRKIAIIPEWDSYFSFPNSGKAYSGVAVYNRRQASVAQNAEEGITGVLADGVPTNYEDDPDQEQSDSAHFTPAQVDSEGRGLILDYGLFVLFNLYCPHESSEERRPYRMAFLASLSTRLEALLVKGREVIVVGDINICRAAIDHVDPKQSCQDHDLANFGDHPARKWLNQLLTPRGPMIDLARHFYPDREHMYTCWNTKINARGTNYGTRIDYILASEGLLKWIKHCDIRPDIYGSDHCPVVAELHDEINDPLKGSIKLWDVMNPGRTQGQDIDPPKLAAINSYGGQGSLGGWVVKGGAPSGQPLAPSPAAPSPSPVTKSPKPKPSLSTSSNKLKPQMKPKKEVAKSKRDNSQTKLGFFFAPQNKEPVMTAAYTIDTASTKAPELATADTLEPLPPPSPSEEDSLLEGEYDAASVSDVPTQSWNDIFQAKDVPVCVVHKEPAKEYTVNKPGPNHGRRFWLCSRPVGKGYDQGRSKTARSEVNTEYRCDFFVWSKQRGNGVKRKMSEDTNEPSKKR